MVHFRILRATPRFGVSIINRRRARAAAPQKFRPSRALARPTRNKYI